MATFLDVGLLEHFGVVFVVLIVFLILFGLLEYVKAFGEGKRGLHAIISFMVALLFLISRVAQNMIKNMVPWFTVMVIFIFFTLLMVRMFGVGEGEMKKLVGDPNVYPWIIAFALIILFISLGNAFGQGLLERGAGATSPTTTTTGTSTTGGTDTTAGTTSTATPSFSTNLLNTLRHPKVLGMLFIFLVGMFALLFLTKTVKPS